MTSALWTKNVDAQDAANRALFGSARLCFVVAWLGQWIFAFYIAGFYAVTAGHGDWLAWNKVLTHGFVEGNVVGNSFLGGHLLFAFLITLMGPLQFIAAIRARRPGIHRWSGRVYVVLSFMMGISGLYLVLSGRKVAGDGYLSIAINALLIMFCAVMVVRHAIARNLEIHRRWALRLFLVVNGVWFFRVGLMLWLVINHGPVGFNPQTFKGPFLTILGYGQYLIPLTVLQLYLTARDQGGPTTRLGVAGVLITSALAMSVGIAAATMGLWVPRLISG